MKDKLAPILFLVLSVLAVGLLSEYTPLTEGLEYSHYDFQMATLRGEQEPPDDILIVAIDNASRQVLQEEGFAFPWPRGIYALLLEVANAEGSRAVVFDLVFDLDSDPQQDQALAQAIAGSRVPVVLAASLEQVEDPRFSLTQELLPLDLFLDSGAHYGFATILPDSDQVLRHGPLTINGEPSLSTRTITLLTQKSLESLQDVPVARNREGDPEILIDYVGSDRAVPTVSFWQVLDYENSLPEGIFRDKVLVVGRSESVQDLSPGARIDMFATPFGFLPGAEIHANLVHQFLRGQFIGRAPDWAMLLIMVLLPLAVTTVLLLTRRIRRQILLSAALMLGYIGLCWLLFLGWEYWLRVIQPVTAAGLTLVTTTFYEYRKSDKERRQIRQALKGYVSGPVMDQILESDRGLELGGELVTATVLFSDIEKFSKIAEKTTPKELAELLNQYFTMVGDAIMTRQGMINKYIGDAVMAIWGAPLAIDNHAALACDAALAMRLVVDRMPEINTRIGLNTGTMVAGNLGHRERMEYTVIGDEVNLASRLEGANKAYGTSVMISESTEQQLDGRFVTRPVDWIRVVGKRRPVRVFELVARSDEPLPADEAAMLESFAGIVEAYEERDWERAVRLCREHLERFAQDGVVRLAYLPRCVHFLAEPPEEGWDGVFELKTK